MNTRLPIPVRVQVFDAAGRPVPNFVVDFVVTSGGGSVFGGAEITNSSGYADERWTLGPRLGPQTLEARDVNNWSGVAASRGDFTAIGTAPHVQGVTTAGPTGLATVYADGTNLTPINTTKVGVQNPWLTADHQRVVFYAIKPILNDGNSDSAGVFQINVDGTNLQALFSEFDDITPHSSFDTFTSLAPDGRSLVLEHVLAVGGGTGIFFVGPCSCVLPPAPSNVAGERETEGGSISPDMTRIAFEVGNDNEGTTPLQGIWTALFSGSTWTQLSTFGDSPAWSPDGQHIAFLNGTAGTYVMDADGNNVRQVSTATGSLTWSPDGQLLGVGGLLMNIDGTNAVPLPAGFRFPIK